VQEREIETPVELCVKFIKDEVLKDMVSASPTNWGPTARDGALHAYDVRPRCWFRNRIARPSLPAHAQDIRPAVASSASAFASYRLTNTPASVPSSRSLPGPLRRSLARMSAVWMKPMPRNYAGWVCAA
jgi:hypothetical protein